MMVAYTVYLYILAVEPEPAFCTELNRADSERGFIAVNASAIYNYLCHKGV